MLGRSLAAGRVLYCEFSGIAEWPGLRPQHRAGLLLVETAETLIYGLTESTLPSDGVADTRDSMIGTLYTTNKRSQPENAFGGNDFDSPRFSTFMAWLVKPRLHFLVPLARGLSM